MSGSFYEIKVKADLVRNINLKEILKSTGATQDRLDKNKWHTPQGVISVTGTKFMNWNQCSGGGGAIDLIIHLKKIDFKTAVDYLSDNFSVSEVQQSPRISKVPLKLPVRDNKTLTQVISYLRDKRHIPLSLIKDLIYKGTIYSDNRSNAVFLLLGKEKRIVGAELRGTTELSWHGMAYGSRKDLGYFYVSGRDPKEIVLCESAIDAISYFVIRPDRMAASTSGITPNPLWLKIFINKGCQIYCGYDSDEAGDKIARRMIELYPSVKRLRPHLHDWNDVLRATQS